MIYQIKKQTLERNYSSTVTVVNYHSDYPSIFAKHGYWCCALQVELQFNCETKN